MTYGTVTGKGSCLLSISKKTLFVLTSHLKRMTTAKLRDWDRLLWIRQQTRVEDFPAQIERIGSEFPGVSIAVNFQPVDDEGNEEAAKSRD